MGEGPPKLPAHPEAQVTGAGLTTCRQPGAGGRRTAGDSFTIMIDRSPGLPLLTPVRVNDNELIFFDYAARESWILYPPRSRYLSDKRLLAGQMLVERRRWTVSAQAEQHVVSAAAGCAAHGLDCAAQRAVQATADIGWNPFQ